MIAAPLNRLRQRAASVDPKTRKRAAWIITALIVANEIRGAIVVASLLWGVGI